MTDLCDLQLGVLPLEIKSEKFVLRGEFCLQINRILDVSQPKYSQLQEIQNKENANNFITAETQTTQKPWEARPTRMLMLTLTDGVVEVSGMEYQPIVKLTKNLQPGTKVRIKGPVNCRRGVLMLRQNNIEVIGGVVEDLVQDNRYEAVLCRGLGRALPSADAQASTGNELSDEVLDEIMADVDFDDDSDDLSSLSFDKNIKIDKKNEKCHTEWTENFEDDVIVIDDLDDFLADAEEDETTSCSEDVKVANQEIFNRSKQLKNDSSLIEKERNNKNSFLGKSVCTANQPNLANANVLQKRRLLKDSECTYNTALAETKKTKINSVNFTASHGTSSDNGTPLVNREKPSLQTQQDLDTKTFAKVSPASQTIEARYSQISRVPSTSRNSNVKIEDEKSEDEFQSRHGNAPAPPTFATYLCQAKRELPAEPGSVVEAKVKALVITLLSKLKSSISGWSLSARICDGTEMLDVDFSNEVLKTLIGFTVAEAEQVKGHPSNRNQLKEGMEKCRDTIITLCHPMNVTIMRGDDGIHGIVNEIDM